MNVELADRLIKLRRENNLSQEQLAAELGISRQAVSKWERAESSPDLDNIVQLAKLYNISFDELLNTSEYSFNKEKKEQIVKYIEVIDDNYINWFSIFAFILSLTSCLFPIISGISSCLGLVGLIKSESHNKKGKVLAVLAIIISVIIIIYFFIFDLKNKIDHIQRVSVISK